MLMHRIKKYAQDFVSSHKNSHRLNKILKEYALSAGETWTCDIEEIYSARLYFYYENKDWKKQLGKDYSLLTRMGIHVRHQ